MAALWLSETWNLTRRQRDRFRSWGSRMFARVVRCQRSSGEALGDFWRRLHRTGRSWLESVGGDLEVRRRRRLHSFAGHLARSQDSLMTTVLRTRNLAWWRHSQQHGTIRHPGHFFAWRWEQQVVSHYGETVCSSMDQHVGWLGLAQDRQAWKVLKILFLLCVSVPNRGAPSLSGISHKHPETETNRRENTTLVCK